MTPLSSILTHMEAAPEDSPERLTWANALCVEAFRDESAPQQFGPPDPRHPMVRLFTNLIADGQPVLLVDDRGTTSFNGARHVG